MHTEWDGAKENRRSFEQEKNKELFEAQVDKNEEHVTEKKKKHVI